jgi:hypothetical protein
VPGSHIRPAVDELVEIVDNVAVHGEDAMTSTGHQLNLIPNDLKELKEATIRLSQQAGL